jgi:cytochrome c-type biogenesis protein CcmH
MTLILPLLSLSLLALCLSWTRATLLRNLGLVVFLSLCSLGLYFVLGYPQGVILKEKLIAMDQNPSAADYQETLILLQQHLYWHPDDALAQTFQGRLYFANQEPQLALQAFAKAYALLPEDPDLLVEYATALYLSGQDPQVLAQLVQKLNNLDEMPYSAYSLLANIAMDNHQPELARAHWLALLPYLPPDSPEAQQVRAMLIGF